MLRAAKLLESDCEQQRFLRVYASSKGSCVYMRAAKVLVSVSSSKGSC